ncbi:MAG: hypothetical protein CL816_01040 [Coxiellaceae bacterium]|nr:hypothetical protein [Coxiellaceae bacterium]|tara:strand:+ start:2286 stop:2582 length:297 start_codon:yes stop_codon:yes gene_type:complete
MNYRFFVYFVFYTFLFPLSCFSYSNDIDSDQITNVLNALVDLVTSAPAKILLVLAIIGVGYSTLALGKMNKSHALGVIIGIGVVFSAGYIAEQLGLGT